MSERRIDGLAAGDGFVAGLRDGAAAGATYGRKGLTTMDHSQRPAQEARVTRRACFRAGLSTAASLIAAGVTGRSRRSAKALENCIDSGDYLSVEVQNGRIVLIPEPRNWTAYLRGLHKEVWEGVDVDEYIRQERDSWRERDARQEPDDWKQ